jgi:CheY-like chemotaxis protein
MNSMVEQPAPPHLVLALLDNLFFAAKIGAAATQAGLRLATTRTWEQALTHAESNLPVLIVIDLDAQACRPFDFIQAVKADARLQVIPLLGFVAHVNTGIQQQARAAGCDRVLARSVFSRDLPQLLQMATKREDLPLG